MNRRQFLQTTAMVAASAVVPGIRETAAAEYDAAGAQACKEFADVIYMSTPNYDHTLDAFHYLMTGLRQQINETCGLSAKYLGEVYPRSTQLVDERGIRPAFVTGRAWGKTEMQRGEISRVWLDEWAGIEAAIDRDPDLFRKFYLQDWSSIEKGGDA